MTKDEAKGLMQEIGDLLANRGYMIAGAFAKDFDILNIAIRTPRSNEELPLQKWMLRFSGGEDLPFEGPLRTEPPEPRPRLES